MLEESLELAFRPPVGEQEALLAHRNGNARADIAQLAAYEAAWGQQAEANYAKARRLAEQALARVR